MRDPGFLKWKLHIWSVNKPKIGLVIVTVSPCGRSIHDKLQLNNYNGKDKSNERRRQYWCV